MVTLKKKINNKKINLNEFKIAQQNYTDLILKNIPKNVKNILDVGSGCGTIAKKLIDKNYYVDCVSPDPFLSKRIIKNIGDDIKIYENKFENIKFNKKYDLILFSESFQYIDMKKCMIKIKKLLNDDGFVLITDCFKKDICNMRGGYNYNDFNKIIKKNNLRQIKKIDITYETSMTLNITFINYF
jgi:SAM-dependent methyltransferase